MGIFSSSKRMERIYSFRSNSSSLVRKRGYIVLRAAMTVQQPGLDALAALLRVGDALRRSQQLGQDGAAVRSLTSAATWLATAAANCTGSAGWRALLRKRKRVEAS